MTHISEFLISYLEAGLFLFVFVFCLFVFIDDIS